ncbi:heparinase II/III family protein [Rhodocaloribacter litoris]|uniref:heparinase II/III domain-containing protein n=1 Tax=Rhodocaloribacter litoris TaxID=2558931 RepID=UPI00142189EA|nr:heparinase II/III family protein [Rhodocaloribacter litoris]QXD14095.1 heparinase II/III family protein [Rhodocaloribacter litoris]
MPVSVAMTVLFSARMWGVVLLLVLVMPVRAQEQHPKVFITASEAAAIREARGHYTLLDATLEAATEMVEAALAAPIETPPPGEAGGYAHERHKQNYREMYHAGLLYQITGDRRYAAFVRDMLLQYAEMYPALEPHPLSENQVPGKLFHQLLNENVWLVHTIIGYDCVYDALTPDERATIEANVFYPMVSWFMNEGAYSMNRIHNHGTWTVAAVGMAGYVLGEPEWVEQALYGTDKRGEAGFMRQLDLLFSPDGYYMEGPYYARYAIWPFFYFAEAIQRYEPERNIYGYRDGILRKALYATVQTALPDGTFPALNDASLSMNVAAPGVVLATDLVFERYGPDPVLLGVAGFQNAVVLNGAGLAVARAYEAADEVPEMTWPSVEFRDGADGEGGGLGILRVGRGKDQTVALMKYGVHGLGHGHFDKLSILFYDQRRDVLDDYGFARFVNVEPKYGGRYLPENDTWAKQTIAHNTVVVDGRSQNDGDRKAADAMHADRHFFDGDPSDGVQSMSAYARGYYTGVDMQRTVLLVEDEAFDYPLLIDLFRLESDAEHQYDYPIHYDGIPMATSFDLAGHTDVLRPLGEDAGYQHIWETARARPDAVVQFSWLDGQRYYTLTTAAAPGTEVLMGRTGAHDPHFNLRSEPLLLLRRRAADHLFASVIEPHGYFSEASEQSSNARPYIAAVRVLGFDATASVVEIEAQDGRRWQVFVNNGPAGDGPHTAHFGGKTYTWTGNAEMRPVRDGTE